MRVIETLLLGFLLVAGLLLGTSTMATWRFYALGQASEGLMNANVVSIQAVQAMMRDVDRIDRLATDPSGAGPAGLAELARLTGNLRARLADIRRSTAMPRKNETLEQLAAHIDELGRRLDAGGQAPAAAPGAIVADLGETLRHLLELEEIELSQETRRAEAMVRSGLQWLSVFLLLGLLAVYAYYQLLSHSLAQPLRRLLQQVRRIAHGEMFLRLSNERQDEFGQLAIEVNRIVDQLDDIVQQRDRLRADRQQTAQSLLEQYAGPALVLDLRQEVSLCNSPGRILLLSSGWQQDLERIQSLLQPGEFVQGEVDLADGKFRMNQAPMRDRHGNLIGTLATLLLMEEAADPRQSGETLPRTGAKQDG